MTALLPALHAHARIETATGPRYLQQLCKHFAHKLPVTYDAATGHIAFPMGDCRLAADADALDLALSATSAQDMAQLKDVVVRHLERFAFREPIEVSWSAPAPILPEA